ncbi:invasion protein expression up-regulator SirB [Alkanindiges illinoisensis]|uniref:Invasion protein expression up-regulator SirB n=1 Tax=Alkanindiges illinoisensis TaxID=197183 RepID=A0A4Y7XA41_9GAMM|nr:invasion protein expression up-regulator SirB [Alkanindiges illinoisensis]
MDSHLILKIIHMTFGSLALISFLIRAALLFRAPQNQPAKAGRIVLVALQHLSFTVLVLTGMVLLYQNQFVVQPWFYGKIILFVVILSATIKAFGKRDMSLAQRKAGAFVAAIAFAGLLTLVVLKPDFSGNVASQQNAQSVAVVPQIQPIQQNQLTAMTVIQSATH